MNIPEFKNKQLFSQVFTHRSYLNESPDAIESNERLEFLGDSILSFIVSSYIYEHYPSLKEGELTSLRSVLTNTQTLYQFASELDLGNQLKLSKGEESTGGRINKTILANTFEALLGGIFIDQGIEAASKFVHTVIILKIDEVVNSQGLKDPKSMLQEKTQEKSKTSPLYKIVNEEGPDHAKIYTAGVFLDEKLLAEGSGHSKQEAEKSAAANALKVL
ncbi:MAG TPA: ribonuclease III [Candidatus Levybacteria bacterium]|nr:ribonuclease III [Candidatus Levybacteria bacterium]